jgi:hypothetical protein
MYRHDQYRSGFNSGGPTGIADNNLTLPDEFALSVFPNPFNSAVKISVGQTGMSNLRAVRQTRMSNERPMPVIEIYDLAGKMVAKISLAGNALQRVAQKNRQCRWSPAPSVPSGVYLVRAKTANSEITKKIVYLK